METDRPRAERRVLRGPGGHAAITAALVALGGSSAVAAGAPAAEVWAGAGLAWSIQAASVWRLVAALEEGRSATRPWVAGMAARLGGLGLVAVLAWSTALLEGTATALAYVATVVPLLWLEGYWLNRAAASATGEGGARPDPDGTGGPDGARSAGGRRHERRPRARSTDERTDGR